MMRVTILKILKIVNDREEIMAKLKALVNELDQEDEKELNQLDSSKSFALKNFSA